MILEEVNYNAKHVSHDRPMTCVRYIACENMSGIVMFEQDELKKDDGLSEDDIKYKVFEKLSDELRFDEDSKRYLFDKVSEYVKKKYHKSLKRLADEDKRKGDE